MSNSHTNQNIIMVPETDLKLIKDLGKGEFGRVSLYQYTGNNPEIQKIQHDNLITLKSFETAVDENEINNIGYITANANGDNFLKGVALAKPNGQVYGLASEFIAYDYTKQRSASLEKFFAADMLSEFDIEPAIAFAQICNSMVLAQKSLHDINMLHLDTAARNYMMGAPTYNSEQKILNFNVKIIDYGLSRYSEDLNRVDIPNPQKAPLRWLDRGVYRDLKCDARTDVYSNKVSMIEFLGWSIGRTTGQVICMNEYDDSESFIANRRYKEDDEVLMTFLDNVKNHAKSPALQSFLTAYQEFLTTMPNVANNKQFVEENHKLYMAANARFLVEYLRNELAVLDPNNDQAIDKFLLNRDRLFQLEFSNNFKDSLIYQNIASVNAAEIKKGNFDISYDDLLATYQMGVGSHQYGNFKSYKSDVDLSVSSNTNSLTTEQKRARNIKQHSTAHFDENSIHKIKLIKTVNETKDELNTENSAELAANSAAKNKKTSQEGLHLNKKNSISSPGAMRKSGKEMTPEEKAALRKKMTESVDYSKNKIKSDVKKSLPEKKPAPLNIENESPKLH